MSALDLIFQSQVETVLGALVKEATVELTKLFESHYQASTAIGPAAPAAEQHSGASECVCKSQRKVVRSVGVQVNESDSSPSDQLLIDDHHLNGECLNTSTQTTLPAKEEGPPPADKPLGEDNGHADLEHSLLKEDVKMVVEGSKSSNSTTEPPVTSHLGKEVDQRLIISQSARTAVLAKLKPLLVRSEHKSDVNTANQIKFVCPLILKTDVREPERPKEPVQVEPQQANVSTAEGTAYSPSSSDEAMAPVQVSIWERIHTEQETENHLQLKLKLVSSDRKLTKPCSVHLVNVLASESEKKSIIDGSNGSVAKGKSGLPGLKDLRRHQGPHTGHRLCCFTRCANGVWRLHGVVAHSHSGYACSKCGKKFKHRKILRRHERFHSGEKPYACSHCSKSFALRKSLRRHERFHTGERPHNCPQCGKSFRLRDNLKAHLRFHTGDKPFICGLCSKRFRILRNLQKHNESPCGVFVPSFRKIAGL